MSQGFLWSAAELSILGYITRSLFRQESTFKFYCNLKYGHQTFAYGHINFRAILIKIFPTHGYERLKPLSLVSKITNHRLLTVGIDEQSLHSVHFWVMSFYWQCSNMSINSKKLHRLHVCVSCINNRTRVALFMKDQHNRLLVSFWFIDI